MSSKLSEIHQLFLRRSLTLAVAESCTGGLLSSKITSQAGASQYFLGAVVSYHARVKTEILQVPLSLIQVMGEVSTPVAVAMARGVREKLKSDWALAITGVAGPSGGTAEKPVGYVCFSVCGPGYEFAEAKNFGALSRAEIQNASAEHALLLLGRALS